MVWGVFWKGPIGVFDSGPQLAVLFGGHGRVRVRLVRDMHKFPPDCGVKDVVGDGLVVVCTHNPNS